MLNSHGWLVHALLDRVDIVRFHHYRKLGVRKPGFRSVRVAIIFLIPWDIVYFWLISWPGWRAEGWSRRGGFHLTSDCLLIMLPSAFYYQCWLHTGMHWGLSMLAPHWNARGWGVRTLNEVHTVLIQINCIGISRRRVWVCTRIF